MVIATPNYNINCGKEWSRKLNLLLEKGKYSDQYILCDENTFRYCLPTLITECPGLAEAEIIEIEPGEASKSVEIAVNIWKTLSDTQADRHTLLVNLGGGVVTDLGGFCASVYKRGIAFINVPTSLLAMADASVGSKTGVDFEGIKNLLGTFKSPDGVFINPGFVQTLPVRHYYNGLTEIYKIALVSDKRFWNLLQKKRKDISDLALVEKSIILKKKIVQKDPLDKGLRKILNFGHSTGHAIESACINNGTDLLHGEAVLAGMILESHISWQKKYISKATFNEILQTLQSISDHMKLPEPDLEELAGLIMNDKKVSEGKMYFALIDGIGSCRPQVEVNRKHLDAALEFYNSVLQ